LLIRHWLRIRLSTELIFKVNDRCSVVLFVTYYGFVWQEYLLRDSIMLVVAVCFANSFLTSNRKLRHITYKIYNYWCIECTVLIFIHMESTNVFYKEKITITWSIQMCLWVPLIMVKFHYHLAGSAVWVCGDNKLSCKINFHYILLLFYVTNKCH
jgi:hypothetical protein